MKEQYKLYLVIAMILLSIFTLLIIEISEEPETHYCEIYADQELTAMRTPINGGEKQYSLNGYWVKESLLFEDCER